MISELALSCCRKQKRGRCLSQCESTRLLSSQTTSFTSLLAARPASRMREMRLLSFPSNCWKRARESKKPCIAILIRYELTSRGQTVSAKIKFSYVFCQCLIIVMFDRVEFQKYSLYLVCMTFPGVVLLQS
jgi:hypothetical protein